MFKGSVFQCNQSNDAQVEQQYQLLHQVIQEGIRQANQSANQSHWSFLIATVMSTAGAAIGVTGAVLLLLGNASEGTVTAAVGLASKVHSYQLSKDAADRQRQANERLDQMLYELTKSKD